MERARQIAEPLDEPVTLAFIYGNLAGLHHNLAQLDRSMEWAWHAIAFGERKNYPPAIATGY